jgi:ubiquinone/menaquinone biosynthesis C-methylase UbiE
MENKLKIDFLSGYNPLSSFKSCDYIYTPKLDFFFDINNYKIPVPNSTVSILRCRNALHHIAELEKLAEEFFRVLLPGGKILVIECREPYFKNNVLLDTIWYRSVSYRDDIWFATEYRDYEKVFTSFGFCLKKSCVWLEKEIKVFKK